MYRQFSRILPLAVLAAGTFWLVSANFDNFGTMPALCCCWFVAGLVAMGRLHGLQTSQLVLASLAVTITACIVIYYAVAAADDQIGALALLSLFLIFSAQALLRRKYRSLGSER